MRFSFTTAIIIFSIGAYAAPVNETVVEKSVEALDERADIVDFYNPTLSGGSFLDLSAGLGEPLNVILFLYLPKNIAKPLDAYRSSSLVKAHQRSSPRMGFSTMFVLSGFRWNALDNMLAANSRQISETDMAGLIRGLDVPTLSSPSHSIDLPYRKSSGSTSVFLC